MVFKFSLHSRLYFISVNHEGANKSEKNNKKNRCRWCCTPEEKEDDLNPTDDGEASEESHGASNKTQLGLRLDLLVSLDVVKGGRVKVDL